MYFLWLLQRDGRPFEIYVSNAGTSLGDPFVLIVGSSQEDRNCEKVDTPDKCEKGEHLILLCIKNSISQFFH